MAAGKNPYIKDKHSHISKYEAELVFLPGYRSWDSHLLDNPSHFGVSGGSNHYVEVAGVGCCIGVWTIPSPSSSSCKSVFCNSDPVVLYVHGQTSHRGSKHRTELYRRLQALGLNLVTFDYRGFGDSLSEGSVSVETVVRDTEVVLAWLRDHTSPSTPVIVWGHSLGSAVASHLMSSSSVPVCSLVLESAFNNLSDELYLHSWATPWRLLLPRSLFSWLFSPGPHVNFVPDQHLPLIHLPVIIIHSHHDPVVSVDLASKLFRSSVTLGQKSDIEFIELLNPDYGHSEIYKSPQVEKLVNTVRRNCNAQVK